MLVLRRTACCCCSGIQAINRNFKTINYLPNYKLLVNNRPALYNLNGLVLKKFYATTTDNKTSKERIYLGTLTSRIKAVKVFSLTTSLAGIAAQPILLEESMKLGGTGLAVFVCGFAGFFTFVTPFLLHFITKKYVTEIYYDPSTEEYTATTISLILQKNETKFNVNDVKVPDVPGMFTSFLVNNKALFVEPSCFNEPEHYARIMGFDKPLDFKLELNEIPSETNKKQKI